VNDARLSIINKSDLIIDSRSELVFFGQASGLGNSPDALGMSVGRHPHWFHLGGKS
jgi:hypothetical protein